MRDRAQLLRILGILALGGFLATIFVVVPILGQLKAKELGFIPTGFPVRLEFFVALFAFIVGISVIFFVGRRRPPGTPLTWGEAILAGTYVFGILLLGYGVVPNEWLKWADNQLLWRPDRIWFALSTKWPVFYTGANAATESAAGRGRIIVSFQALRDIIAATIYILMLVAQVWLWVAYQKRGRRPAATQVERTSMFGRPVVKGA
ncbi:MAG: hypothetical protein JO075_06740 [Acidimicrobiia bacterium]|nr:hypothetical protein [Acidimicrobiia bacterium]